MNMPPNATKGSKKNEEPQKPMMKRPQSITFWIVLILFAFILYQMMISNHTKMKDVTYSQFLSLVYNGQVKRVIFDDQEIKFVDQVKVNYQTRMPFVDATLIDSLYAHNVDVVSKRPSRMWAALLNWLPFVLIILFWLMMMRSMQGGGGNKAFSFGKSRARLFLDGKTHITFKDVAGVEEAKEELQEIVEFLKSPQKFQRLGGRIPRGLLLLGRPGTGKTLLAKAVAGEAGVPFFSISGSDFVEMFVGVGASRVRDLFENAKKHSPCIAFIDEIDAVGRSRGAGLGGGHDEREQTLNQLLVEMDGFEPNEAVIIIAATNRPDVLDPALLRPGRFDRQVVVDLPDIKGRAEILKVHTKLLPLSDDVNLNIIARGTPGFSGADLANLANEAALLAARKNQNYIGMKDFDEAKDKVTMGKERKSRVIMEEEKNVTAVHEVGHVLCSVFQENTEPVHKVTIIPRGFSAGATHFLQTDKSNYTKKYLVQMLVELLGGRAAEEITFNEISTGASNDILRATEIARKMVCQWGMSEKIGPMTVGKEEGQVFLGKDFVNRDFYSEDTAKLVDNEIRLFIENGHKKSKEILQKHKELMNKMSQILLEKETLDVDEIFSLVLENVEEEDLDMAKRKYQKAQDMKLDAGETAPKATV